MHIHTYILNIHSQEFYYKFDMKQNTYTYLTYIVNTIKIKKIKIYFEIYLHST